MCLSSAWSITRAVNPPRAAYVDYPLGHTAGKPLDTVDQLEILTSALALLETAGSPGTIKDLEKVWTPDDSWKDRVMRPHAGIRSGGGDERIERFATPQYQNDADRAAAGRASECSGCLWIE